jgi:uncharacterized protein
MRKNMEHQRKPNRLINETSPYSSPYLLQHAENPVDWYPWGEEALRRAQIEDKPILLSIGYSACHWCHVMAHESFENENIARIMNDKFVNIKVDREERPDLDTVYMDAVQSITGSGGWPLTVFLTPEGKPFYGGTYFPPEDSHGLPGFARLLGIVADHYRNNRRDVDKAVQQILSALSSRNSGDAGVQLLTVDILNQAYYVLRDNFDNVNGGFGQAPKFPQPMVLEFLLRHYHRTADKYALEMATLTLERMAEGGIYDQVGGGFHRYSTDEQWLVPHFEKMLYDNALLSRVYLHAYLITGKPLYRRIAEETNDYVIREMTGPGGGFYSTQDADSEGEEGRYYTWTLDEIRNVCGEKTAAVLNKYWGVTESGNFEGRNILHVGGDIPPEEIESIRVAKELLLKERDKRVKPGRDKKILCSWNGLMLSSLAESAAVLDRKDYLDAAIANGSFLLGSMASGEYLMHSYTDNEAKINGYLDDFALVIEGLLSLHQSTFSSKWLKEAIRLTDVMVNEFWNGPAGVLYDTGKQHQALFVRPRNTHDGAMPSGLSAATLALLKISRLTGNEQLEQIALKSLQNMMESLPRYPLAFGHWLCALDFYLSTPQEIAIIGSRHNPATLELLEVIASSWNPNRSIAALDPDDPAPFTDLILLKNRGMINNQPTVYLCEGNTCRTPVNDAHLLRAQLHQSDIA